jgi:hypothetical protein
VEREAQIFEQNAPGVLGEATRVQVEKERRPLLHDSLSPCLPVNLSRGTFADREALTIEALTIEAKAIEAKAIEAKAIEAKAIEAKAIEAKAIKARDWDAVGVESGGFEVSTFEGVCATLEARAA